MTFKTGIWDFMEWLLNIPAKPGMVLRALLYPLFIKTFPLKLNRKDMIKVYRNVRIKDPYHLEVGKGVSIEEGCMFMSEGGVSIGDYTLIAPGVHIITHQHSYTLDDDLTTDLPQKTAAVHIGRNVWIGARAVILPGVTIGENSVIAAGSIVNRNVAPGTLVGGVPARPLG